MQLSVRVLFFASYKRYSINISYTTICYKAYLKMRPMIDAAWDWAKSRNLWRVNPIHKEDEIKVIVDDFFKYSEEEGIETQQIGTMETQDYSSSTVNCNM